MVAAQGNNSFVKLLLDVPGIKVNLQGKVFILVFIILEPISNATMWIKGWRWYTILTVYVSDQCGQTALMVATYHTRLVIMRLLLARPEIQADLQDEVDYVRLFAIAVLFKYYNNFLYRKEKQPWLQLLRVVPTSLLRCYLALN